MNVNPNHVNAAELMNPQDTFSVCRALRERMEELTDMIGSGDYSDDQVMQMKLAYNELRTNLESINSGIASRAVAARVLDAIQDSDAFVESLSAGADAADTVLGEESTGGGTSGSRSTGRGAESTYEPGGLSSEWLEDNYANGAELVRAFEDDPEAFGKAWRDLESEDRQLAMQALQQEIALNNQLTQMLTSLSKSIHDTMMVVARNLQI